MRSLHSTLCRLALVAVGLAVASVGLTAAAAADDLHKVAPWVLEQTTGGNQAEMLVVLTEQADLSGAKSLTSKQDKGRFVFDQLWQTAQRSQAPLLQQLTAWGVPHRSFYIVNLILVEGNRDLVQRLAARTDVARIEGNPVIDNRPRLGTALAEVNQGPDAPEPGISYINAPAAWALGFDGEGIVIAGADTGIFWQHPALIEHYRGWNGVTANHSYSWHDSVHFGGGSCGDDSVEPCDDHGHGTHTIGTTSGGTGSNEIGVAPGARWIGCRNMDQGAGLPSRYLECFQFFLAPYPIGGTPGDGNPDLAPHVTNNSWGCPADEGCSWDTLQAGVQAQRAAGIVTVVSAGNDGPSCSSLTNPAPIYEESFTVGALSTGSDIVASFSSRGPVTVDGSNRTKPDISAPGTSIRSSLRSGSYGTMSGTSMAGPHVAGAVALVLQAFPELIGNVTGVEELLSASASRISTSSCSSTAGVYPNNVYGWGRIDLSCAIPGVVSALGPVEICTGDSTSLRVDLSGSGPWDLTWSDTFSQNGETSSPVLRTVNPTATTTYQVSEVANASCTQAAAGAVTVTVWEDLSQVQAVLTGAAAVCPVCLGGTAEVTDTNGGPVSHQWGYRFSSGGAVTSISGATGSSYQLNGADFPGPGSYLLVVESTPTCGSPQISNEIPVTVDIPVELQRFVIE